MNSLPLTGSRGAATLLIAIALLICGRAQAGAEAVFLRFKVTQPAGERFHVVVGGFRHADPWYFPEISADAAGGAWSGWLDLSKWPWHGRLNREGGKAEWPSLKLTVSQRGSAKPVRGCTLAVELSDSPDAAKPAISFTEKSESNAIAFLAPTPLRQHASEFETGSQMAARHHSWAQESTGGKRIALKKFGLITSIWGHYDPGLGRQEADTLRQLGFNVIGGVDASIIRDAGMRPYGAAFLYDADPAAADKQWKEFSTGPLAREKATAEGAWRYGNLSHWVISDEVSTLDFRNVDAAKRDAWFRAWLRETGVVDSELPGPVSQAVYPAAAMYEKSLPHDAPLPQRKLLYYAAKFGQWWSAKQLRHSSDLVKSTLPGTPTETLPTDHGFLNAWGPPHIGMSYRLLDLFELGAQRSVDQLSAEDWLGLNHMYGSNYTWTGAQTFAYFNAVMRSAIGGRDIAQRGLVTPSDDAYLRLKAYSALGQGVKSFFFWTYGPTYIGTENYWSDLRSEYDGLAKLNRALAKTEDVLFPAKPVRDPVAILYSVSHDIWHTDDAAAFVEKRLLWHALRHDGFQPDFLREEDMEQGRLKAYKVLYIPDWCVSRRASAAIDAWVRAGGILYLSAGAAIRDEFYEPYVPPFAQAIWPEDAARQLVTEKHAYNERGDLPTLKPMTRVTARFGDKRFTLPVLGCRLPIQPAMRSQLRIDGPGQPARMDGAPAQFAGFADGSPAGVVQTHGRGRVVALGFLPMLAYGQLAGFKPSTLGETWPQEPRDLIHLPIALSGILPAARASVPVVEASLLTGPAGSALVLANYTYKPIRSLTVDLKLSGPIGRAVSAEGKPIRQQKTPTGIRLELPLDWTDIVVLPNRR